MSAFGSETVVIVAIDQPLCTRQYGDAFTSPTGGCQAVLGSTGDRKCYNTRSSCQDSANYNPGTLTLYFSRKQEGLRQYGNVLPCIRDNINTTPGAINLGGMDRNKSSLGQREVVTLACDDFKHSDLLVDKYRLERSSGEASFGSPSETFDPYERGTFWGKFLARNPYHSNYALRVYEGYVGDAIEDMRVRHYVIDRIEGPNDGQVRIVAKDRFSQIERVKAVAPKASRGELDANIADSGVVSFTLSPAGIGNEDYPASGHVAIGDEIIAFTRSGDTMTVVTRGALGTVADEHEEEDLVQLVLSYTSQQAQNIVFDLLCNYTALGNEGSPTGSAYIDKAAWDSAASSLSNLYSAHIGIPTPVQDLIGELAEQVGFTVWYDPESGMIEFKVLRTAASSAHITDNEYIVDGSLSLKPRPEQRASQIWVYYGQRSPLEDLDDENNFRSRYVDPDFDAEDAQQYGTASIRPVFSRWISQFGRSVASGVSDRLLAMFRDPPVSAEFSIHASRADEVRLAGYVTLQTADVQDETGAEDQVQHAVVELERGENEIRLKTQSVVLLEEEDERVIFIEHDNTNLNLREIHDEIFAEPVGGSPTGENVRFVIEEEVVIGSTSSSSPAITTGSWPSGVVLTLENRGRIQGKGGAAGSGGAALVSALSSPFVFGNNGTNGEAGGTALVVAHALTLDNSNGQIWGGGGGGGGGGGAARWADEGAGPDNAACGGSGGGGGAGTNIGTAGSGASGSVSGTGGVSANGNNGTAATTETNGTGGASNSITASDVQAVGGAGGNGGAPGQAGSNGGAGSSSGGDPALAASGSAGTGGAAGKSLDGIALVTQGSPTGDIRGPTA